MISRKEYLIKNKDKIAQQNKEYYEKNKEKIKQQKKERDKINKEKNKEKRREYLQTPAGKKSSRIQRWKTLGVLHDDYDTLYKEYLETDRCDICGVNLTEDKRKTKTTKCLDHDHETGFVRNIVCHSCNIKIG